MKPERAAASDQPAAKANTVLPAPPGGTVAAEVEEWAVETSCYLCYAQCVNFGVHGKGGGRPCAKGMADVIEHLRVRRRDLRTARELAAGEH